MSSWSGIRKKLETEYLAPSLRGIFSIMRHHIAEVLLMRDGRQEGMMEKKLSKDVIKIIG